MYDSEYFRKVIGNNYNPNELYNNTTYDNNERANIYSVDTQSVFLNPNVNNNDTMQVFANSASAPSLENYNVNNNNIYNTNAQNVEPSTYNTTAMNSDNNICNTSTKIQYPDIYNVINPMVDTVLKNRQNIEYNEVTINAMSTEIYNALEVDVNSQKTNETDSFSNSVQVNARPKNHLLHDLIKIMLIGKIERGQ